MQLTTSHEVSVLFFRATRVVHASEPLMRRFSPTPSALVASLWENRALVRALVAREVLGRYRGSMLGVLWSLLNPILMLTVYTFVFSVVFKARWSGGTESRAEFALALFVGLIAFNLFAECVNRAPGLVLANANYVKKVVFPLEILPVVSFGAAMFHALVSLCVWLLFYVVVTGLPPLTAVWLPVVLLPLMLFVLGASWALASLGVYLRDVGQVMGLFTTALMFLSPIFYPAAALPDGLRRIFHLNPLTPVIEMARDVLMWGRPPAMVPLVLSIGLGALVAWLGFAWFQKTRKGFADVL
jgi:lipopolysaccharide transport system permease protein